MEKTPNFRETRLVWVFFVLISLNSFLIYSPNSSWWVFHPSFFAGGKGTGMGVFGC